MEIRQKGLPQMITRTRDQSRGDKHIWRECLAGVPFSGGLIGTAISQDQIPSPAKIISNVRQSGTVKCFTQPKACGVEC
jgi:hypothetical protein